MAAAGHPAVVLAVVVFEVLIKAFYQDPGRLSGVICELAAEMAEIVHEIAEPWMFDAPDSCGKTHRITAKEVEAALVRLEAKGAFSSLPSP